MPSSTDTVAAFEALLSRAKEHAKGEDLIGVLLLEINTALGDILACMEKPASDGKADAMVRGIAAALSGLKMPEPIVNLTPTFTVQAPPEREQLAPTIVVNPVIASPAGAKWRVEMERSTNSGLATAFTVTKI